MLLRVFHYHNKTEVPSVQAAGKDYKNSTARTEIPKQLYGTKRNFKTLRKPKES